MNVESMPFSEIPYIAIDVETTGFDSGWGHRICEIALLKFLRGNVIDSIVSFVNPLRAISPGTTALTGITDAMVSSAPLFTDLYPKIISFVEEDVLVFHNAPFDLSFLGWESHLAGGLWPSNRIVDTLRLARRSGRFPNNSLSAVCRDLGIYTNFHRAASDAWAA
jgi:DNA polymerase-3 subunit epsilon